MVSRRGRLVAVAALGAALAFFAAESHAPAAAGSTKKTVVKKKKNAKAKKTNKKAVPAKAVVEQKEEEATPPAAPTPEPAAVAAPEPTPAPPAAAPSALPPADPAEPSVKRIDAVADQASAPPPPPPSPALVPAAAALAPAAAQAPPAETVVEPAAAKESDGIGLGVSLKLALMLPAGRTANATAVADAASDASRGVFGAGALQLRWSLPFLERALALEVEGGFFQLAGDGARAFANDPDFGPELSYHWETSTVPVLIGASYRLPIPIPVPLAFTPEAGFAAVWVRSQATYTSAGSTVTDAAQVGWALGFYLGLEATFDVGLGSILAEVKYINARTDLGFQEIYEGSSYNASPGDVEGTHLALGYRFSF